MQVASKLFMIYALRYFDFCVARVRVFLLNRATDKDLGQLVFTARFSCK